MDSVVRELKYLKPLHLDDDVVLSSADQVWQSDSCVNEVAAEMEIVYKRDKLKAIDRGLSFVISHLRALNPGSDMRDAYYELVDPNMYPLMYGMTRVLSDPIPSPEAALSMIGHGKCPESLEGWGVQEIYGVTKTAKVHGQSHGLNFKDMYACVYLSEKFCWLLNRLYG